MLGSAGCTVASAGPPVALAHLVVLCRQRNDLRTWGQQAQQGRGVSMRGCSGSDASPTQAGQSTRSEAQATMRLALSVP